MFRAGANEADEPSSEDIFYQENIRTLREMLFCNLLLF